jgi:putative ABC transport system ATP-binding protein
MTPEAECVNVARTYRRGRAAVVAVHGVSCALYAGQRVALTGRSGSGKTTLLHLLAGIDTPTAGTVRWPASGVDRPLPPGLVGLVFQGPSLLPALDVADNVRLPLLLAGHDPSDAMSAGRRALDTLGIGDLANALPDELSGGQAQRVAVARAVTGRPRLLLCDEPTGQLDQASGAAVVDALLLAAGETGAALVLSTHDPNVAQRLPEQWAMSDGALC